MTLQDHHINMAQAELTREETLQKAIILGIPEHMAARMCEFIHNYNEDEN